MKKLLFVICLLYVFSEVCGQDTVDRKNTLNNNYIRDPLSNPKYYATSRTTLIINGEVVKDSIVNDSIENEIIKRLDPHNILTLQILKSKDVDNNPTPTTVLIITKQFALISYQKNIGASSKEYKSYIEHHQNNDEDLIYVLNGNVLKNNNNGDLIKKLYDIPIEKIKSVNFMEKHWKNIFNNNKPIIVITTRK